MRDVVRMAELLPVDRRHDRRPRPLEAEVVDAAGRLANLEFAGSLDRAGVLALLKGARVSVVPSRWQEPGGIAALEAMSVGTPVVAYDSGGLAEYVGDAGGGRVVEPDVRVLARECEALHADPEGWEQLSAAEPPGSPRRTRPSLRAGGGGDLPRGDRLGPDVARHFGAG